MHWTGPWRTYAQHECLLLVGPCYSGDYSLPAMVMDVCPRCGEPCDLLHRDTWARVVRRRISDAVWYRPTSWRDFHWEYRELGHLADGGFDSRRAMRNARGAATA
ncbi:MAG: hypothetical protein ACYTF9_10055, partial [Planctomycetota bacterium]